MLRRVKSCFSHALIFAAQVCAIYVVILLSGLLVFWSAIFIDSKGRKFSRQEDSRILRKHHREIGKTMAINRVTDIEFADSKGAGKDTVSAQGQSTEPETYDADIPF